MEVGAVEGAGGADVNDGRVEGIDLDDGGADVAGAGLILVGGFAREDGGGGDGDGGGVNRRGGDAGVSGGEERVGLHVVLLLGDDPEFFGDMVVGEGSDVAFDGGEAGGPGCAAVGRGEQVVAEVGPAGADLVVVNAIQGAGDEVGGEDVGDLVGRWRGEVGPVGQDGGIAGAAPVADEDDLVGGGVVAGVDEGGAVAGDGEFVLGPGEGAGGAGAGADADGKRAVPRGAAQRDQAARVGHEGGVGVAGGEAGGCGPEGWVGGGGGEDARRLGHAVILKREGEERGGEAGEVEAAGGHDAEVTVGGPAEDGAGGGGGAEGRGEGDVVAAFAEGAPAASDGGVLEPDGALFAVVVVDEGQGGVVRDLGPGGGGGGGVGDDEVGGDILAAVGGVGPAGEDEGVGGTVGTLIEADVGILDVGGGVGVVVGDEDEVVHGAGEGGADVDRVGLGGGAGGVEGRDLHAPGGLAGIPGGVGALGAAEEEGAAGVGEVVVVVETDADQLADVGAWTVISSLVLAVTV